MTRYIDADALTNRMYHDAFETDTDMQKWDSGCWIRYKMFENAINDSPTIDAVEVVRCKDCKYGSEDYPKNIFPDATEETYSCDHSTYSHDKDFYCKYGKRNNNE